MNIETILISAVVGVVTSLITAYVTTRFKIREEREKWQRDLSIKYLEAQTADSRLAEKMAVQFAVGFLKYKDAQLEPQKVFIPPNYRLTVGRGLESDIRFEGERYLSRMHSAFVSDDTNVYIEHLGSTNATYLNGKSVETRARLKGNDLITIGPTAEFTFFEIVQR